MTIADSHRHSVRFAVMAGAMAVLGAGCLDSSGLGVSARDAAADRAGDGRGADAGKVSGSDAAAGNDGVVSSGGATGFGGALSAGGIPGAGGNPSTGGIGGTGGLPLGGIPGLGGFSTGGRTGASGGVFGSGGTIVGGRGGSAGIASGGTPSSGDSGVGGAVVDAPIDMRPITPDASDAGIDRGGAVCGARTCGANEYCCSPSCGLCTRIGGACIDIVCSADGGITSDAGNCRAMPSSDGRYCGGLRPPHAYLCTLSSLAAPCVIARDGLLAGIYCCP